MEHHRREVVVVVVVDTLEEHRPRVMVHPLQVEAVVDSVDHRPVMAHHLRVEAVDTLVEVEAVDTPAVVEAVDTPAVVEAVDIQHHHPPTEHLRLEAVPSGVVHHLAATEHQVPVVEDTPEEHHPPPTVLHQPVDAEVGDTVVGVGSEAVHHRPATELLRRVDHHPLTVLLLVEASVEDSGALREVTVGDLQVDTVVDLPGATVAEAEVEAEGLLLRTVHHHRAEEGHHPLTAHLPREVADHRPPTEHLPPVAVDLEVEGHLLRTEHLLPEVVDSGVEHLPRATVPLRPPATVLRRVEVVEEASGAVVVSEVELHPPVTVLLHRLVMALLPAVLVEEEVTADHPLPTEHPALGVVAAVVLAGALAAIPVGVVEAVEAVRATPAMEVTNINPDTCSSRDANSGYTKPSSTCRTISKTIRHSISPFPFPFPLNQFIVSHRE